MSLLLLRMIVCIVSSNRVKTSSDESKWCEYQSYYTLCTLNHFIMREREGEKRKEKKYKRRREREREREKLGV